MPIPRHIRCSTRCMSTNDPSGQEPEGGGKPSFDKQPPQEGTPSGAPSDPYGAPPPPPPTGSPYDTPGDFTGTYGAPPPGFGTGPGHGAAPPPTPGTAPGAGPVPGMPPLGTWPNRIVATLVDFVLVEAVAVALVVPFASF